MIEPTHLARHMRERADADNLPPDAELRTLAAAFDQAKADFYRDPPRTTCAGFVGAWTRARRAWCELTGEPLL